MGVVQQHLLELPEGLGEVLQLVVEVDVLLYQRMDRILQFEAPTLQDHQRQEEQRRPSSPHGVHRVASPDAGPSLSVYAVLAVLARFFFTTTGFWLFRMALARRRAAWGDKGLK
ncbi:hypothetical protein EYF80_034240 [Liparis tanakae]|uniref:Uncharacterized protein n=1 Tax=Liparis tanakae TaxID=230148 RepID=A0A4Z2GPB5_9TELE|nr:hypothetical protein EYF80_034240 [Liparis tanakae]